MLWSQYMLSSYLLIWGSWALFGATAVAALVWASRHQQWDDLDEAARSIFDAAEPEGVLSDQFPDEASGSVKGRRDDGRVDGEG